MYRASKYCPDCDRNVMHYGRAPSEFLHSILCLFTCGLWIPVWAWYYIRGVDYRCDRCGTKN